MPEPASRRPVILVVDDTPLNLDTLTELLRHDYTVRPALNGRIALKLARGHTAPDLILLDIMMPELDGYEVLRRLRDNPETAAIPVIFITALTDHEHEIQGLALGAADYITKPFSPPVVLARVRTQLALRHMQRDLEQANRQLMAERELVEEVLNRLRETEQFDSRHLRYHLSSVDRSNGDLLLAAFTPAGQQRILVGDIAGHGPSAAACAPLIGHLFYSATAAGEDACALLRTLNGVMYDRLPPQTFMCFALIEIDAGRQSMQVWNGGLPGCVLMPRHAPPCPIPSRSMPLGLSAALPAGEDAVRMPVASGDLIYLFTDGVTEIEHPNGSALGEDGALSLLTSLAPPESLAQFIDALASFQGSAQFSDDLTLVELTV